MGRNAAEAVASATFQSHAQLRHRHILAFVLAGHLVEFAKHRHAHFHLVALDLLNNQQLDAFLVVVAQQLHEIVGLIVLAAQADDKHATCIGVKNDVAEHLARVLVVARQLRTAIVVVPGVDGVDACR